MQLEAGERVDIDRQYDLIGLIRYHPWNDKHRKVLKAYGEAPPPPDPFYEEIKASRASFLTFSCSFFNHRVPQAGIREAFPEGCGSTKMRLHAKIAPCWQV